VKKILIFGESDIAAGVSKYYLNTIIIPKEQCDIRNRLDVARIIKDHKPDVIINCAGVSNLQPVLNSNVEKWREEIDVNFLGSYHIARESVHINGDITLIFLASVAGKFGKPNHSGYCASKAGVISLVQSLSMEGYSAYAISPGRVDTKMREKDFPGEDRRTRLTTKDVAIIVKKCIEGQYQSGDNIIIRKRGFRKLSRIDKGQPWRQYLNVKPII
jgi:NAD(P)-dependent dehydrogenase (short-subunit alcohol dehydrogenase family)